MDYENVAWFLKKYKKYHYVKETPYSVTFATVAPGTRAKAL